MKFNLTRPCDQCPFRTDVDPYLEESRVREIEHALLIQQRTFSCHRTVDYSKIEDQDDEEQQMHTPQPNEQHCAGAMILLEKLGRPNQLMRIFSRFNSDGKGYDPSKLQMDAPVFDTFAQMAHAQRRDKRGRHRKAKPRTNSRTKP